MVMPKDLKQTWFQDSLGAQSSPQNQPAANSSLAFVSFMTLCTALNLYDSACPQEEIYTLQRAGVMINIYRWPPALH